MAIGKRQQLRFRCHFSSVRGQGGVWKCRPRQWVTPGRASEFEPAADRLSGGGEVVVVAVSKKYWFRPSPAPEIRIFRCWSFMRFKNSPALSSASTGSLFLEHCQHFARYGRPE